jgi:type IV secretion system protein VirD4
MKTKQWMLGVAGSVGVGAVMYGTAYLAGWIILPILKVPLSAHHDWIWFSYWHYYPALRSGPLAVSAALGFAASISPVALVFMPKKRSLHGDATFATSAQVRRAGLHADKGIIVGQRDSQYLVFGGQQHVLMSAPTRSGKGVGVVIPNLLNWPDSVVVLDIKQENWGLTAGFRAGHGQACFLFNPAAEDRRTHRYNPLHYISNDPAFRINDVQKIAGMLYPDLPNVDPIWNASCRSMFVGIVLYLKETPELPCTLGQVLRTTLTNEETSKYLQRLITERANTSKPISGECVTALNDFIGVTSENTRSSIKKTFTARLELWLNPVIDAATSANDFDLRALRRRRISLYVGITPDNLDRLQIIINVLFQQILDLNTRELPQSNPELKYSCLLLMDEFTAIGKISVLSKGISYIAGYNLRMLPIIQSPAQLREVYGKDAADTFTVNHAMQIVFAPREFKVCQEISESLGYETVKSDSTSKAKNFFDSKKSASISTSDQRRALLLPQEVRDIGPDNAILLLEGTPPIRCKKIKYYRDDTFTQRLHTAPDVPMLDVRTALETVRPNAVAVTPAAVASQANTRSPSGVAPTAPTAATPAPAVAIEAPAPNTLEPSPTTVALLGPDPFGPDPFVDAPVAPESEATKSEDLFAGFSLDFSDVKIEQPHVSEAELKALHRAFLADAGVLS